MKLRYRLRKAEVLVLTITTFSPYFDVIRLLDRGCQTHLVLWAIFTHLDFTRARQFCT